MTNIQEEKNSLLEQLKKELSIRGNQSKLSKLTGATKQQIGQIKQGIDIPSLEKTIYYWMLLKDFKKVEINFK